MTIAIALVCISAYYIVGFSLSALSGKIGKDLDESQRAIITLWPILVLLVVFVAILQIFGEKLGRFAKIRSAKSEEE